ncbi:M13 family metallopeptidase [Sphingomonas sp. URHD0057]|uniref:M13 family metallopeptidase n=1 Tax=Sphingomonas sp. URHD0057 TaxID=1380389 RepID=UPI001E589692|nr:M13 family metallopeptidase [Sphingomonas sp. URHD0057]
MRGFEVITGGWRQLIPMPALGAIAVVAALVWTPPVRSEHSPNGSSGQAAIPQVAGGPEIGAWGFDLAGMDRSIRAGDDFFGYANGGWARHAAIPADQGVNDVFSRLEQLSAERTRAILEAVAREPGSKIGDFYASFLDRRIVDARGLTPIAPTLGLIDAATTPAELAGVMGRLARSGVTGPFEVWVEADDKNPDSAAFQLAQAGLGLPSRDDYLSNDAEIAAHRTAYRAYLIRLLSLAGASQTIPRADAVLAFETALAKAQAPLVDIQDVDSQYNPRTTDQLAKATPSFAWPALFDALGLASHSRLIARQPDAIARSAALIAATPVPVFRDYLRLRTLDTFAPYLAQPFVDAAFEFHGKALEGTSENQPLWKRASDTVALAMGDDIGRIYVERYFPSKAKAEADALVRNVLDAWDRHLQGLRWMSPKTRSRARAKLAALVMEIGYPRHWRDYSELAIQRNDLAGNVMRSNAFEYDRLLHKLGRPYDKTEWYTQLPAMGVNGYANHKTNQVVFSAGLLQPPFFDADADAGVNYGAIGSVIAHEIGHEFDQQGARYDERGRLSDWWTPTDVKRFKSLTATLVAQYNRYEPLPGKHIDGKVTLAENIADLAGVTIAYDAYKTSLHGSPAPVLDGFSGDQRFFLGWAQIWRCVYRRPVLLQRLMTDIHSPVQQRVATVRNVDAWYPAFGVGTGKRLYLPPAQRVRIW